MGGLIRKLNDAGIRYIVIGGQAIRLYGMPRFSMDWDLFIPSRDKANFRKLNEVFADEFDVDVEPMVVPGTNLIQTYQTKFGILQFHLGVPGIRSFDEAEKRSVIKVSEDGEPVRCLGGQDLLASKKATNRPHDQQDIAYLKELERLGHLG